MHYIFLNLYTQFSHAFHPQLTPPFLRLPGAVTTHLLSLVAKAGGGGVGARRDSWAPARSSCWVSLLVTEISWEDSLFISLDSQSSDRSKARWGHLLIGHFSLNFGLTLYGWAVPFHQSSPFHCLKKNKKKKLDWGCGRWHFSFLRNPSWGKWRNRKREMRFCFEMRPCFSEFSNDGVYLLPCPIPHLPVFGSQVWTRIGFPIVNHERYM